MSLCGTCILTVSLTRHFYRYLYKEFTTLLFTSLAAMFSVSPPICQHLALFLNYCFFYCQVFLASEENYGDMLASRAQLFLTTASLHISVAQEIFCSSVF